MAELNTTYNITCSSRSAKFIFVVILLTIWDSTAFSATPQRSSAMKLRHLTNLYYRDDSDHLMNMETLLDNNINGKKPMPSDFQSRMRRTFNSQRQRNNIEQLRPTNMKTAVSLQEFADVINEGRREEKVVVVKFYATWCKKCQSIRPFFNKAASTNPDVIFLDVPATNTNINLHQGLGVPSVPFGHIYHPEKGLVEEIKLSRKDFPEFEGLVKLHCS